MLLLLAAAVIFDLKSRKVPNFLIAAGLILGMAGQLYTSGIQGLGVFAGNVLFPILILYLLFLIRALGAADIKLFSVIGGCAGFPFLIQCIMISFITGAVFSLLQMLRNRNLCYRLITFYQYGKEVLLTGKLKPYPSDNDGKNNLIHFSLSIFISYVIGLGVRIWE
ncbi:MAG: prepilin peptidase [Eubacterium sp.]|nr:prepilin peptidase [Eubacterium sp.]